MKVQDERIAAGLIHLRKADRTIAQVIDQVGPFEIQLERNRFRALVRSIISQQISGGAARSIYRRLLQLMGPGHFTARRLAQLTPDQLRSAGISPQKAGYLLDLAQKLLENRVQLNRMGQLSDDVVIEQLTQVKGIGVWTAQMFLIFSLGRLDVFPSDDLGVRAALRNLYGLKSLPDSKTGHQIAAAWRPFATVASWYCWRSLELPTPR